MTRAEYLENAFNAFNSGRISEEVYDAMLVIFVMNTRRKISNE